jgi:hypothetical protein
VTAIPTDPEAKSNDFINWISSEAASTYEEKHGVSPPPDVDYITPALVELPGPEPNPRDPKGRLQPVPNAIMKQLMDLDPVAAKSGGKRSPYIDKIVEWGLQGHIDMFWDTGGMAYTLAKYHELKHNQKMDLPSIEDLTYEDLSQIADKWTYHPHTNELVEKDVSPTTGYSGLELMDEVTVDNDRYSVYELIEFNPNTQKALCDSGWCVKDEDTFNDYMETGPLYIFTKQAGGSRTEKRYGLAHRGNFELRDINNDTMSVEYAAPLKELLPKIFDINHIIRDYILSGEDTDFDDFIILYPEIFNEIFDETIANATTDELIEVMELLEGMASSTFDPTDYLEGIASILQAAGHEI